MIPDKLHGHVHGHVNGRYVDVWICFETDSLPKPSLDELSTSKRASKRVGLSTFRNATGSRFFWTRFDKYAYIPRAPLAATARPLALIGHPLRIGCATRDD